MNTIERIYQENQDIGDFAKAYFLYLGTLLDRLNPDHITAFMSVLEEIRESRHTIFIAGNGGSAATASHMGSDFGCVMFDGHTLNFRSTLPFKAQPLTDHVSMMTAIGNDFGYDFIFTKQLEVQYRKGDALIVISASGNSQNLINAAEWVHERNGKVLGLLGFDGGKLKGVCDVAIVAETPKGEYGPVEDIHMIMDHMFTAWMQLKLSNKS